MSWLCSFKKVKVPIVSIVLSQLCDFRVGAHLRLHDSELQTQLSYVGGRPHLSHILSLPSRRLAGTKLHCLVIEAHVCEQLAHLALCIRT